MKLEKYKYFDLLLLAVILLYNFLGGDSKPTLFGVNSIYILIIFAFLTVIAVALDFYHLLISKSGKNNKEIALVYFIGASIAFYKSLNFNLYNLYLIIAISFLIRAIIILIEILNLKKRQRSVS